MTTKALATTDLLRLLREEAPADELAATLDTGGDPDAVALALEIHRMLAERQRRGDALRALYDTAGDLSTLRDIESVLEAIVRRARALLHTDVAYLMLNDHTAGDTYMRTTDGIETDVFKSVRLDMGAGLGGLVAATAKPYYTADYVNDPRFKHTVDDAVSAERLVAIIGVPLRSGSDVMGVLFGANRHVRPFADDEVALLISLADHAAIALENAQLFDNVNRHSESVERAAALHERFTRLVLQGAGVAELAETVADALGGPLLVLDAAGRVRAQAGLSGERPVDAELRAAVHAVQDAGRTVDTTVPPLGRCWLAPVRAGTGPLGALLLGGVDLIGQDLRTFERAALVTALVLLTERAVAEAEQRTRGELLDDLFAEQQRDPEALRRRTAVLGLDLDRPLVVAAARPAAGDRRALASVAATLAEELGGLSGEHGGNVVLLLPGDDASTVARDLARRLGAGAGVPVTTGVAGPRAGAEGLNEAYREAVQCQQMLLTLDRTGESASPQDIGVYGLLFSRAGRDELDAFVRRTIGPLVDYDRVKSSELFRTITAYFDCDGNITRTASALFVHVNTLYQRLDRIAALLGADWRHGDRALQVNLACRLHRLVAGG